MAERGGTSSARSGTGQPSFSRSAALASQLYADRSGDARARNRDSEGVQGSDSLEETLDSPLDLPDRSYAANDNDMYAPANDNDVEDEGPAMQGSAQGDINKQSRQQAAMLATAAQFIGSASELGSSEGGETSSGGGKRRNSQQRGQADDQDLEAEDEEAEAQDEAAIFQYLQQARQRETQKNAADTPEAEMIQQQVKQAANAWKAAKFGTAVTVVGLLVTLLIMNVQLINQVAYKSPIVPRLSLVELAVTIFVDLLFLALFIAQVAFFMSLVSIVVDLI